MRRQLSAWARRTSVSRRGNSDPFSARKRAVQLSRPPTVHSSVRTADRPFVAGSLMVVFLRLKLPPQSFLAEALLFVVVLEGLDQLGQLAGDDRVELVE